MRGKLVPLRILRQHRAAAPIDTQDQRRILERAEHDGDAAIGDQMRVRLVARSAEVEIGDALVAEHAKRIIALGAQVDPRPIGRGRDEEDRLARDEGAVFFAERIGKVCHAAIVKQ